MDSRLSFLLLVLLISFVSTNARSLVTLDDFGKLLIVYLRELEKYNICTLRDPF